MYLVVVVFAAVMLYFFAKDGVLFTGLVLAASAFFAFVLYHFDAEYQEWREESSAPSHPPAAPATP
jgi:hypothetical protein